MVVLGGGLFLMNEVPLFAATGIHPGKRIYFQNLSKEFGGAVKRRVQGLRESVRWSWV